MSQLKEMHRIVCIVEQRMEKLETENANAPKNGDQRQRLINLLENLHPKVNDVKDAFKLKYNCSQTRANNAYSDAVKEGFLKEVPKKIGTVQIPHFVTVPTKGRKLTSKDFKIPTGRYNTWLSEHSALSTFIGGGAFALVLGFLVWLLKFILTETDIIR